MDILVASIEEFSSSVDLLIFLLFNTIS